MRRTLERYRAVREALRPFEGEALQENLIQRDGGVEMELERMRLLLARVRGRVEGLERQGEGEEMDVEGLGVEDEEKKVESLLGLN